MGEKPHINFVELRVGQSIKKFRKIGGFADKKLGGSMVAFRERCVIKTISRRSCIGTAWQSKKKHKRRASKC